MDSPLRLFARDRPEFDRGLGFFDALYGFAITLLIANVDIPPPESWESLETLLSDGLADQLLGFVISFVVIAAFWKRNTELLGRFSALDSPVIIANLFAAGFIVFLPFTTQGISDMGVADLPLPTALYALNVTLTMLSLLVMYEIGRARGLVPAEPPTARWAARADVGAQMAVFLISIPIAYAVSADWAKTSWLALIVIAPILGRVRDRMSAEPRDRMTR